MQIRKYIPIGSQVNNTYINGISDKDYLIEVDADDFYNGINYLADNLSATCKVVGVEIPSVRVLHRGLFVDITPCVFLNKVQSIYGEFDNYRIYDVNGYKETCPQLYSVYLNKINKRYKNKIIEFVKKVKYWKYQTNTNIPSFYIELLTAEYFKHTDIVNFDNFVAKLSKITDDEIKVIIENLHTQLTLNSHDRR